MSCISELKQVLQTPIKPFTPPEENSTSGQPSDDKDKGQQQAAGMYIISTANLNEEIFYMVDVYYIS